MTVGINVQAEIRDADVSRFNVELRQLTDRYAEDRPDWLTDKQRLTLRIVFSEAQLAIWNKHGVVGVPPIFTGVLANGLRDDDLIGELVLYMANNVQPLIDAAKRFVVPLTQIIQKAPVRAALAEWEVNGNPRIHLAPGWVGVALRDLKSHDAFFVADEWLGIDRQTLDAARAASTEAEPADAVPGQGA